MNIIRQWPVTRLPVTTPTIASSAIPFENFFPFCAIVQSSWLSSAEAAVAEGQTHAMKWKCCDFKHANGGQLGGHHGKPIVHRDELIVYELLCRGFSFSIGMICPEPFLESQSLLIFKSSIQGRHLGQPSSHRRKCGGNISAVEPLVHLDLVTPWNS